MTAKEFVMAYHCQQCPRRGAALMFTWLAPLTERERESAAAAGATLPDPPLIQAREVWCPDCVLARRPFRDVVDDDGQPAFSHDAPTVFTPSPEEQAARVYAHMSTVPTGRLSHGAVLEA